MAFPRVEMLLLMLQVLILCNFLGLGESGVVIENRSNETGVAIYVYDGELDMVLEIGFLDAGSIIDWDAKNVPTNYSAPLKSPPPVPLEHLFVIKSSDDNITVTRQYFYDGTRVAVLDDSIGGLSIKASSS